MYYGVKVVNTGMLKHFYLLAICCLQSGPATQGLCDGSLRRKQGRSLANYWQRKWSFVCVWVSIIILPLSMFNNGFMTNCILALRDQKIFWSISGVPAGLHTTTSTLIVKNRTSLSLPPATCQQEKTDRREHHVPCRKHGHFIVKNENVSVY